MLRPVRRSAAWLRMWGWLLGPDKPLLAVEPETSATDEKGQTEEEEDRN